MFIFAGCSEAPDWHSFTDFPATRDYRQWSHEHSGFKYSETKDTVLNVKFVCYMDCYGALQYPQHLWLNGNTYTVLLIVYIIIIPL